MIDAGASWRHYADMPSAIVQITPGWNAWAVWQKKELDVEAMMIGLDRDRRLRIWVEGVAETNAANVSDPAALRGSGVQILSSAPNLPTKTSRSQTDAAAWTLDGPGELRFVRFFNKGQIDNIPWPKSDNYLLEAVYVPSPSNPVTSGPGPTGLLSPVLDTVKSTASTVVTLAVCAAVIVAVVAFVRTQKS